MKREAGRVVNDVHSQLNPTRVAGVCQPTSLDGLCAVVSGAAGRGEAVCVAGGRHAMGGQQFGRGATLVDCSRLDRVLAFDADAGTVDVEAGIQWPALLEFLYARQPADRGGPAWAVAQKQTGADRLSLGGALAANVHGRGLTMKPFIDDVESFVIVDASGRPRKCSRSDNAELFSLAIGGYGLFGVIHSVKLRLVPRRKLRRVVREIRGDELLSAFDRRIDDGCLYGDFQFAIDPASDGFLQRGVFSCYEPVTDEIPMPRKVRELRACDWCDLLRLAHTDKATAYRRYADYYLTTTGQLYWSDLHQLSTYVNDYHGVLNLCRPGCRASEVITELYAPREQLAPFLQALAAELRGSRADVIYGTVRLIERDGETFLPWARQRQACVVLNLHVDHTPAGVARAADQFRGLIDVAIGFRGSYYLTYHKWATRGQVESCHPRFRDFLRMKKRHDPGEVFQSEWYRHYRGEFGEPTSNARGTAGRSALTIAR